MKSICVFCASSPGHDPKLMTVARDVGAQLASLGIDVIYGGGRTGLMGAVADGALSAGGRVKGVLPRFLNTKEIEHKGLTELHLVETMHQRKMKMFELSEGFIALPGGFGTLEEVTEMMTWQQLGLHKHPIGFLNIDGFYDNLLALFDQMQASGVLRADNRTMALEAPTLEALLAKMATYQAPDVTQWLKPSKS